MSNLEQYNESVKTYNNLVEKLEDLGVNDNIFKELLNGKYENTFIYMMKYVKGNKKKQK